MGRSQFGRETDCLAKVRGSFVMPSEGAQSLAAVCVESSFAWVDIDRPGNRGDCPGVVAALMPRQPQQVEGIGLSRVLAQDVPVNPFSRFHLTQPVEMNRLG